MLMTLKLQNSVHELWFVSILGVSSVVVLK